MGLKLYGSCNQIAVALNQINQAQEVWSISLVANVLLLVKVRKISVLITCAFNQEHYSLSPSHCNWLSFKTYCNIAQLPFQQSTLDTVPITQKPCLHWPLRVDKTILTYVRLSLTVQIHLPSNQHAFNQMTATLNGNSSNLAALCKHGHGSYATTGAWYALSAACISFKASIAEQTYIIYTPFTGKWPTTRKTNCWTVCWWAQEKCRDTISCSARVTFFGRIFDLLNEFRTHNLVWSGSLNECEGGLNEMFRLCKGEWPSSKNATTHPTNFLSHHNFSNFLP